MSEVEWHPYPDEIPDEDEYFIKNFFVTVMFVNHEAQTVTNTQLAYFNPTAKRGTGLQWYKPTKYKILAWARINFPDPYEPLDMHPDAIAARRYMENHHA